MASKKIKLKLDGFATVYRAMRIQEKYQDKTIKEACNTEISNNDSGIDVQNSSQVILDSKTTFNAIPKKHKQEKYHLKDKINTSFEHDISKNKNIMESKINIDSK